MSRSFIIVHRDNLRIALPVDCIAGVFEVKKGKKKETFIASQIDNCDVTVSEGFDEIMERMAMADSAEDILEIEDDTLEIDLSDIANDSGEENNV